jgi:GntR family transcriptional regulator/MocR family aminotransferase
MTRSALTSAGALAREIRLLAAPGEDGVPLYRRLYRQLRAHILSGHLPPGARLPAARTFAADLRVSRNTVEAAIAQLVTEGFVERRVGAGSVVSSSAREVAPFADAARRAPAARGAIRLAGRASLSARGEDILRLGRREWARDPEFGPCATNVTRFPLQAWNRMLARRARRAGADLLVPADARGLEELRTAIADHASLTRGLRCSSDQVLIVGSSQEALDLAARLVLDPGDTALVEDPGYSGARSAFVSAGAQLRTVAVDDEGIVTRDLPRSGARLVYVTPSHQFPLGATMSLARRMALLRWAAAQDAVVIEDDYDSEFRFGGQPLAALQSLPGGDRVLYVGTFNKVLFPGLRLAYLVLPEPWLEPFAAARRVTSGSCSPLLQSVLAEFISSGQFASYLRQARQFYGRCRDRLVEGIERDWGSGVQLGPSNTGLHLTVRVADDVDDVALARRARAAGLPAASLSGCSIARTPPRGLLLNYGSSDPERLATAARRFAPALLAATRRRRAAAR